MLRIVVALNFLFCLFYPAPAAAWGYQGHRVVGSIADKLLKHNAQQQVDRILAEDDPRKLGVLDLRKAGPWADCAKSVVRHDDKFERSFHYELNAEHPEYETACIPFNSAEERARLVDYVKRNWTTCSYQIDGIERGCHNTYHFDDIAIQRDRYDRNFLGTNRHDVVSAVMATVAVLRGQKLAEDSPFSLKDKKEALLLLTHFVGDLHQPLHVGSVYLDARGQLVDPDKAQKIDPATDTIGGNGAKMENLNLHQLWDDIPGDIGDASTEALRKGADAVPATQGKIEEWPAAWATESLLLARTVLTDLPFKSIDPPTNFKWSVTFEKEEDRLAYLQKIDAIKRQQLAKAGARLAEILNRIWP